MKGCTKTLASMTESRRGSALATSESCLSDDDLLAFVRGQFAPHRSEQVHSHLDDCSVCQRLMNEAAHAIDAEPLSNSTRPSWNTVFQPGAMIAKRYRIRRLIARGGMGEVYEVDDLELNERVALKTVTATHCDNAEAVRLLRAEVQLARRITHPNVCRIFDLGTHVMEPSGSEIQFLVMEYVDGECLGKRLRQGKALPLPVVQRIVRQLLAGLAAAHHAGIVHRDFKSDNVMLRTDSRGKFKAVILDFGLAKVLNDNGSIVTLHSDQAQAMIGTVGYMAPEQIEGHPVTPASDIYALGIVWFEMLTGRLPFEAETMAASAISRLHHPPRPPSHYNDKVPKWLDAIVLHCLGRYPSERFSTAEQVLNALASNADPALPPTTPRSAMRRRTRIGLQIGLGILIIGALPFVVAGAYQTMPWRSKVPQVKPKAAEQPRPAATAAVHRLVDDTSVTASEVRKPPAQAVGAEVSKTRLGKTINKPRSVTVSVVNTRPAVTTSHAEQSERKSADARPTESKAPGPNPDWEPLSKSHGRQAMPN